MPTATKRAGRNGERHPIPSITPAVRVSTVHVCPNPACHHRLPRTTRTGDTQLELCPVCGAVWWDLELPAGATGHDLARHLGNAAVATLYERLAAPLHVTLQATSDALLALRLSGEDKPVHVQVAAGPHPSLEACCLGDAMLALSVLATRRRMP